MLTKNVINRINYPNWWEFTNSIKEKKTSLFRGHSNFHFSQNGMEGPVNEWKIISTFNRAYPNSEYESYPYRQFWENYELYRKDNKILHPFNGDKFLSRLQYFQHYGIPTPLIDFTRNPITALYFATTGVPYHGGIEGDTKRYVTIVEINTALLENQFGMQQLTDLNIDFDSLKKYTFGSEWRKQRGFSIRNPDYSANNNLLKQEGAFVYFDYNDPLENFLEELNLVDHITISESPITFHNIPYHSFRGVTREINPPNLFYFLMRKEKIGMYLFDDMQGLRYDYNNPDILSALNCMDKKDCDCLLTLREHDISF